jgi:Protein of unknown function (DUF2807).
MRKLAYIAFLLLAFSCKKGHRTDCLKGTGEIVTETRTLENFNGAVIQSNFDIELIDTNANFIEITAGENLMDGITSTIENNILTIRNENKCNFVRSFKTPFSVKVYGKLRDIWHQSDGILTNRNELTSDTIILHLEGSEADLKLNNEYFYSDMYQPGDLTLAGNCAKITIELTSFGSFYGHELNCKNANVYNKGEGDIHVNISDTLNAVIFSVGNIYYYSTPSLLNTEFMVAV